MFLVEARSSFSNVFFLVGFLIGALAWNASMLMAGRTVKGVGGGGLIVRVNLSVGDFMGIKWVKKD